MSDICEHRKIVPCETILIMDDNGVKKRVVNSACCADCLIDIVIPELTIAEFYSNFGHIEIN